MELTTGNHMYRIKVLWTSADLTEFKCGQSCETSSADKLHCNTLFQELKILSRAHTVQTNIDQSNRSCDKNLETLSNVDFPRTKKQYFLKTDRKEQTNNHQ